MLDKPPPTVDDPLGTPHPDHTGWSDSSARAVLQLMVESVAEMVGFKVAALSVVLDDELVTMACTGPEEFREYLEERDPVSVLDPVLASAETWGRSRFLAAEHQEGELEGHWVITSGEQGDGPGAWHPQDVLIGVLTDDACRLLGLLSVDSPLSGRRPDASQRRLPERYAAQAERAVLTAFEREALVQQVAHAETARRLIREASMPAHASLEAVLESTHRPLEVVDEVLALVDSTVASRGLTLVVDVEPTDLVISASRSWPRSPSVTTARSRSAHDCTRAPRSPSPCLSSPMTDRWSRVYLTG